MIARAFELAGWTAHIQEITTPRPRLLQTLATKYSGWYSVRNDQRLREHASRRFVEEVKKWRPDICVVLNGNFLVSSSLAEVRRIGTVMILWCYDSVSRYPAIAALATGYDKVYVFEPSDIPVLDMHGVTGKPMPLGYDPSCYFPLPRTQVRFDLSFVGTVFAYKERMKFLEETVSRNADLRIGIWTNSPPYYSLEKVRRILHPLSRFRRTVTMRTLSHGEVNKIYNSSHICLNIHHDQSRQGVNPRTFEIAGSGGFQLVDNKSQIASLYEIDREVVTYGSVDDCQRKIQLYLANEDSLREIARRGHSRARTEHTYDKRIGAILEDLRF